MAEKENLDIPMIATVGIVSTVLTIASVIGVQALYLSYAKEETNRKVVMAPTADADSRLAEQDAKLARYGWANRKKGQVVIPIERAMDLIVGDYAEPQPTSTLASQLTSVSSPNLEDRLGGEAAQ